jgi:hypothetical protein
MVASDDPRIKSHHILIPPVMIRVYYHCNHHIHVLCIDALLQLRIVLALFAVIP